MTLSDFGIKTYEDFKKNIQDIFYIIEIISDQYMNKQPNFVRQEIDRALESYVNVKDYSVGDKDIFIERKSNNYLKSHSA